MYLLIKRFALGSQGKVRTMNNGNNGKIFLSLIVGAVGGVVALVVGLLLAPNIAILLGLLAFAVIALALHVVLSVTEFRMEKQFSEIERALPVPVLYKTIANFQLGRDVVSGKVFVCRDRIVFASVEKTPFSVQELAAEHIARFEQDDIHLRLFTKDGKEYRLVLPDAQNVAQVIRENYWNT